MRRFLGSRATPAKGKERQQYPEDQTDIATSSSTSMEVLVQKEVCTSDDQNSSQPLSSTSTLVPPSPSGSVSRELPPGIRVPTHPYPYWHNHTASSSQSSLESPVTPSHVSWLGGPKSSPAGSSTPTGMSNPTPAPAAGRSSPNLFFPPPPATAPPSNASRSKPIYPVKSTHSLRVPVQEFCGQQLSPIVEQDYMSPEKRPVSLPNSSHDGSGARTSMTQTMMTPITTSAATPVSPMIMNPIFSLAGGSEPTAPGPAYGGLVPFAKKKDEEGGDSPRPSPVFSTFLSRPLNRTISLSSIRTHQSSVSSSTPPVIPPLDLRPAFPGPFLPTVTPTSLTSPGFADGFGAGEEESSSDRRASYITARSTGARESRYSSTQQEHFVDAESNLGTPSTGKRSHRLPHTPKSSPPHPLPDMPRTQLPQPPPPAHVADVISPSHPQQAGQSEYPYRPSAPSLRSLTSLPSASSSFIDRRFADSDLYIGFAAERASARQVGQRCATQKDGLDTVKVLFWFGFIAPWCWLIGGWMIDPRHTPPYSSRSRGGGLLPMWTGKGKNVQNASSVSMYAHGYPIFTPSVASLMPPSYSRVVLAPKPLRPVKNPWVLRCRIAAVVSGLIILVAFIITFVVVGQH
ncbi:hypothetical protein EV401DRAFT_161553 [Pisolithus croceorrhizus]|nr:hypothetical protein EV401DRAFT_161553 [Pisolithus croceorrhizus]